MNTPSRSAKRLMALVGLSAMLGVGVLPALGQTATTTTLALSSAGTPVASGGSIVSPAQLTLTAAVTAGGTAVTKGTVNFCVTGAKLCTDVNLIGSAQLTSAGTANFTFVPPISQLNGTTPIPHSYTAVYTGTTADAKSSSGASTVTVAGTFPTTSVLTEVQTATAPPTNLYTLTDTVTGTTQNFPTGTITFQDTSDNNYVLGTATLSAATSTFVLSAKPLVYSTSGSEFPRYVVVGDVNGDGIPDLAVAAFTGTTSASVDIYFGKGDGTFTFSASLLTGQTIGPQFAVLGDFNNDGCLDVLAESYSNNNILLFLNTKTAGVCTGTFAAAETSTPAGLSGPGGLAIGDFNRDGNLDFVVNNNNAPGGTTSNEGINSLVFFGDGNGNFTAGPILAPGGTINPVFTAVGDYNGDGYLDIAIGNDVSNTIDIYLNNGTGGFGTSNGATPTPGYTPNTVITTPGGTNILAAADFNQDGKLDLAGISGQTTNPITIYLNGTATGATTATFTQQPTTAAPVGAVAAASAAEADFNGDGIPDLIYNTASANATGLIGVLLGKGDGTFSAPTTTYSTLGEDTLSLAVGDFNGDGYSDVAVGNFSGDKYNANGSTNTASKYPNGDVGVYLAGYQTTGTTTASLTGAFVNGVAVNPHEVDAVFPTNSIYTTSTSNTVPLVPSEVMNDTLSLVANPNATTYGQQTALTATLTNYSSQNYTTNGEAITFTLQNTNTVIGSVNLATGVATLNYTALPVGTDNIVANYTSDGNFASATSNVVQVVVTAAPGTGTLTANPQNTTYGTPVLLTDTFTPINGVCPAGPATFTYNGASIGTGAVTLVNGKCTATLSTANLPVGSDPITATVPPSGNFGTTTSGPTTVTVGKAPVTNTPTLAALSQTFVAAPGTITAGSTETFTYTVPAVAGNAPPTGPVVFSSPGLATPITCSTFTAGTPVAATATVPAYTPYSCTSTTTALTVGNPDVVTATYSATDPNYANTPALTQNVIVNAATATTTLVASPSPSTYGTPVTLTETIAPINGVCPAGPATFFNGTTQLGTGTISLVGGSCIATLTTANLPVGTNDPLQVTVPASGPFAAITTNGAETVTKAPVNNTPTLAALSQTFVAAPGTITAGSTETFTYTVPAVAGNAPPTGPVVFSSPGLATPITCSTFTAGTPVAATATVPAYTPYSCTSTTTALTVGNPDVVTATYSATDPNYANTPALTQNVIVNAATATTTLVASPSPSTYGTPVTLTETIAPINGVCPAGPATFFNGTTQLGTGTISLVGGSCIATLTTANLPVGTNDPLQVTVPASGPFAAITTNGAETVTKAPVNNTPTLAALSQTFVAAPGTITAGSTETFTYTVPAVAGNAPPTGPVVFSSPGLATPITCSTFTAGTPVAATATVPAYTPYSCTSTTTALTVGNPDVVTATYSATDPNYANTPALTQNVIVNAATATTTLVASPSPSTYGTPVTLTETIAPINGVCPAGPATFFNGTTQLGTGTISLVGGSCIATLTTANLPVGSDPLKVTVPASGPFAAITTNGSTTVSAAPITNGTTPVLSQSFVASPGTITAGSTETFTYTVPVAAGNTPPTGPVVFSSPGLATPITCTTFTAGTPVTGTTPPYTPYSCTSTTTALAVGNPDVVTATYTTGDPNYAGGAPALTQNVFVNAAAATATLTANPSPSTYGTPVTLTETIAPINGVCPAGPATFFNGTTQLGTGTISLVGGSCIATLTTANLPVGTDPLKVTVPASGPFAAITTNGSTTVSKAPVTNGTTPVLSQSFVASPNTTPAGGLVTLVYTIPVAAGNVAPIGPVVFSSPGLATPITCSTFTAGTPVTGTTPPYTPYSCASTTTALAVGSPDLVTATYTSADPNYANAPALTQNVTVTPVTPGNVITVPPTAPSCGTSVTLTDTITPVNGISVAGGTVQFYDNGVAIGGPIVVPANGIVTLTTTALSCGPNVITSIYTPPAGSPYLPAPGGPVNFGVNPADFTIAATPPNQVVNPGDTVVYTIALAGATVPFNSPVTLTVTGLPKDATVSFGQTTYVPGQGPTTTTMTIVTSPLHSELRGYPGMGGGSKIAFGLLLLPLLGVRRIRRKLRALPRGVMYGLTALLLLAGLGAVTGCGGGYIGPNPGFYTITVTGTSGALVHSTSVQLEVR